MDSTDSCGVAILISPGLDLNITKENTSNQGGAQYIKIQIKEGEDILICNIYAPMRNKVEERLVFLAAVKSYLETFEYVHFLLGGDFNIIFQPESDKQGGDLLNCTNQYTTELLNYIWKLMI